MHWRFGEGHHHLSPCTALRTVERKLFDHSSRWQRGWNRVPAWEGVRIPQFRTIGGDLALWSRMPERRGLVCLVTGGCGFLGQHLVRLLVEHGHEMAEIRVFDLTIDRGLEALSTASCWVKLMQGDVCSHSDVFHAIRGADLVFHLAAMINFYGLLSESDIMSTNVEGTQCVIEACQQHDIQSLIYCSSMEVIGPNKYGDPFHRGNEETLYRVSHASVYSKSKALAEDLILQANGIRTVSGRILSTCSLRPLGIYGEGFTLLRSILSRVTRCRGYIVRLVSKNCYSGRVYVGNVAWMHLLAARALREQPGLLGGEAYFCYDDSPDKSYLDFNMEFLAPCGVRVIGQHRPVLPFLLVYLLASLVELMAAVLRPFCSFTPILNRYTLRLVSTPFTVQTDKAARHFAYRALYSWPESRARTLRWLQSDRQQGH